MKINSKFTRIMGVGLSSVMLASTLLSTSLVSANVSSSSVTVDNTTVGASANYTLIFTVAESLAANGNITITFPSGTTFNWTATAQNITANTTIAASPGWFNGVYQDAVVGSVNTSLNASSRQIRLQLGAADSIGENAQVRIAINGPSVKNPSTAGSYNLTVSTSNETTAVTSAAYVIGLPNLGPLPGQVEGKNSNGDVLYRAIESNLATVIGTAGVSRVELGAGTYNASNTASTINQTIIGVGAAGTVILTAPTGSVPLTVSATGVVIENLTIQGNSNGVDDLVDATANSTFRNVTFSGGVNQLDISSSTVQRFVIENSTFGVTGNVSIGINSASANASVVQLAVTNCTFNVDASGDAIVSTSNLTLSNSTFTGSSTSPDGVLASNGTSTITNNTFTSLTRAIVVSGNTTIAATLNGTIVTATGNTITGNGATSASSSAGSIVVSGGALILTNNTITNIGSIYYALHVSGGNLSAHLNSITNNTLNVRQTSGTANATLNWWGSSSGPAASSLNATTADNLITTPFLVGSPSNGSAGFNTANLSVASTTGVEVTSANASTGATIAADLITANKYATNPQTQAPAGNPIAYFDVAIRGISSGATVTIKFYGNVTDDTKVYYGGGLTGAWALASSQGVNVAGGYAFVTVTAATGPAITDLDTPFVLTNVVTAPAAPTLVGPTGTAVPLNTGFSWNPVTGATSYNFQVSTSPTFATTISSQTGLTSTVYGGVALTSNTTYFWRVQAVNSGGSSAWTSGMFTTAAPAVAGGATLPPITNNITVPAPVINVAPAQVTVQPPNVTVNPPQVTITPPPPAVVNVAPPTVNVAAPPAPAVTVQVPETQPVIPQYILWTIILIGAVLVIALIVLIVRTRRVA